MESDQIKKLRSLSGSQVEILSLWSAIQKLALKLKCIGLWPIIMELNSNGYKEDTLNYKFFPIWNKFHKSLQRGADKT